MANARRDLTLDDFVAGVRARDVAILAQAVTLIESRKPSDRVLARELVQALLPFSGGAQRIGLTGVPGVGKSTFIDAIGTRLTERGHHVAVLAVDPTSMRTGGSILGDKTRMERLAVDPHAFIRPSPSSGTLGGVASTTRETMVLCEAAGFDIILVETVGVGQSETTVAEMTDVFVVLALPGAGDELQGIKKGVLELADVVAVNKADIDERAAAQAARQIRNALHIVTPASAAWSPVVVTCSAMTGEGLATVWSEVENHRAALVAADEFDGRRRRQQVRWMRSLLDARLRERFEEHEGVAALLAAAEAKVEAGELAPSLAVDQLLDAYEGR